MKQRKNIWIVALSWPLLQPGASPASVNSADHPYETIAVRNVFRLQPLPNRETQRPSTPPSPIILQGVSSIAGRKWALMQVGSTAVLLSEGEKQGDVEVIQIDVRTATVKVHNGELVQSLGLVFPSGPARTK